MHQRININHMILLWSFYMAFPPTLIIWSSGWITPKFFVNFTKVFHLTFLPAIFMTFLVVVYRERFVYMIPSISILADVIVTSVKYRRL